jgi:ferredoxin
LAQEDDRAALGISFEPALCTDCGLCNALCPVDAMTIRPARLVREVSAPRAMLMMRRLRACDGCGTGFVPETADVATCPICANEQALDAEWLGILEG